MWKKCQELLPLTLPSPPILRNFITSQYFLNRNKISTERRRILFSFFSKNRKALFKNPDLSIRSPSMGDGINYRKQSRKWWNSPKGLGKANPITVI